METPAGIAAYSLIMIIGLPTLIVLVGWLIGTLLSELSKTKE